MVWTISERWPAAGRRRSRARCTPTDAFSNTVSWWEANGPREGRGRRDLGPSVGSLIELGVSYAADARHNGRTTLNGRLTDRKQLAQTCEGFVTLRVEALRERAQELGVALGLRDPVEQQLDALVRADRGQHPAHRPDHLERALLEEQLLAAGARALDVDRREDALLSELPVEDELRVAGALELLVDDVVQEGAGVD